MDPYEIQVDSEHVDALSGDKVAPELNSVGGAPS